MKLGFHLTILLLASCNSEAKGRPSNESTLLQVQPPAGVSKTKMRRRLNCSSFLARSQSL